MEPHAERRRVPRVRSLAQERGDKARQHIAAAALRERRTPRRVAVQRPVRQGDERPVPLEHHAAAVLFCKFASIVCAGTRRELFKRPPAQAGKFAVVRRDDRHASAPVVKSLRAALQGVQPVGVQHHRLPCLPQKRVDELLRPLPAPQSGSERDHVAALDLILHRVQRRRTKPPVHLRQRKGHRPRALRRLDRPDALRHAEIDEAAARMLRRARREIRRARIAHAAAED